MYSETDLNAAVEAGALSPAAAAAFLALSAGAVLAAEACACCKDMAPGAAMECCDEMNAPAPAPDAPAPAPAPAPETPQSGGHAGHTPG